MQAVARVGDLESGICPVGPSSSAGPLPIASGSHNVFANGMPVARAGDPYTGVHVAIPSPYTPHPVFCGAGSTRVFVNGIPVYRQGDFTACQSPQIQGSPNVFAGG